MPNPRPSPSSPRPLSLLPSKRGSRTRHGQPKAKRTTSVSSRHANARGSGPRRAPQRTHGAPRAPLVLLCLPLAPIHLLPVLSSNRHAAPANLFSPLLLLPLLFPSLLSLTTAPHTSIAGRLPPQTHRGLSVPRRPKLWPASARCSLILMSPAPLLRFPSSVLVFCSLPSRCRGESTRPPLPSSPGALHLLPWPPPPPSLDFATVQRSTPPRFGRIRLFLLRSILSHFDPHSCSFRVPLGFRSDLRIRLCGTSPAHPSRAAAGTKGGALLLPSPSTPGASPLAVLHQAERARKCAKRPLSPRSARLRSALQRRAVALVLRPPLAKRWGAVSSFRLGDPGEEINGELLNSGGVPTSVQRSIKERQRLRLGE